MGAIWRALDRTGRSLHPFDLHDLDGLFGHDFARADPLVAAWLDRTSVRRTSHGDRSTPAADDADLDGDDPLWSMLGPAERAERLAAERRRDSAGARLRLARGLSSEPAATRERLVRALRSGLGPDDAAFLESLATDRSSKVRDAALELLAQIPGTARNSEMVDDLVARIEPVRGTPSLGRKSLRLRCPERLSTVGQRVTWALSTFMCVPFDLLCARLERDPFELARAARPDPVLQTLLLALDSLWPSHRHDDGAEGKSLDDVLPLARRDLVLALAVGRRDSALFDSQLLRRLLDPSRLDGLPDALLLTEVLGQLPGAADDLRFVRALVDSRALSDALDAAAQDREQDVPRLFGELLASIALLVPTEDRAALRARLSRLPVDLRNSALERLALLEAIETDPGTDLPAPSAPSR
ncbi:DUF5691 domain-containing protein [Planctomycetes bacterium Pla163]|uniref:DUF5691 domain-containing protein n=1 Tax=Rohdeia mirabilis TaxID=2528008 RepID=UPI00119F37BC